MFEVYWDTNANEHLAIAVAWYFGVNKSEHELQTAPCECSAIRAEYTRKMSSNEHHPNIVANVYRWMKLEMQNKVEI